MAPFDERSHVGRNRGEMGPTLWVDVEDLFEYATENARPSGIQRLAFEIYRALHIAPGGKAAIAFVRHGPLPYRVHPC